MHCREPNLGSPGRHDEGMAIPALTIPALTIPAISGFPVAVGDSLALPSDRAGRPLDLDQCRSWLESRDSLARLRWGWDTFGDHLSLIHI